MFTTPLRDLRWGQHHPRRAAESTALLRHRCRPSRSVSPLQNGNYGRNSLGSRSAKRNWTWCQQPFDVCRMGCTRQTGFVSWKRSAERPSCQSPPIVGWRRTPRGAVALSCSLIRALAGRVQPQCDSRRSVAQHDTEKGVVDLQPAVVLDEPELPKLVHEEVHTRARGPNHLGQCFL
jgi:hypothetical protein